LIGEDENRTTPDPVVYVTRMLSSSRTLSLLVVSLVATALFATTAAAATITEFPIGTPGSHKPHYIEAGPDGNLWFTDRGSGGGIARISPAGEVFAPIGGTIDETDLAFGSDGTLYWVGDSKRGKRDPSGFVTEVKAVNAAATIVSPGGAWYWGQDDSLIGPSWCVEDFPGSGIKFQSGKGRFTGFAFDPSGAVWGVAPETNRVANLNGSNGAVVELPVGSDPRRIVLGSDGNLWVTMWGASAIDQITPTGLRTRFQLPAGSKPLDITAGPDGALWFTEFAASKIGRITTAGVVTDEFATATPSAGPIGITTGPDGNLWFTESSVGKIGRLVPDPPAANGPGPTPTPGPGSAGGATDGGAGSDRTPPAFASNPSFSPARFTVSGGAKASATRHGKVASGSKLNVSLSEAANLTATVSRSLPGRRKGGRCVAPGTASKGAAKCVRLVTVGTQSWSVVAGASQVPFSGKVAGKALKPGSYSASLSARDAAGNVSEAKAASFTVVLG
jgi:streptogramin lyase